MAYSTTVPAPHPVAEIVPTNEGGTLLTIERVGAVVAPVQVLGCVTTGVETGLVMAKSPLQLQRVLILCTALFTS
jgi:hypothetical protein